MKSKSVSPVERLVDSVVKPVENPTPSKSGLSHITHEGLFVMGDIQMKCYILSNGERVFDADDFEKHFGELKNLL